MKRGIISVFLAAIVIMLVAGVSAKCSIDVKLLNQDPYPATPGEYENLVFQLTGVDNPECGKVNFKLLQDYPISLDTGVSDNVDLISGGFLSDYGTFFLVPYRVKIDKDAINEDYTMKTIYKTSAGTDTGDVVKKFFLTVNDTSTDFDVVLQDYNPTTNTLTFAIVNIGKNNAEALTLEIPDQGNIKLVGNNKAIIGSLNKNDDTTANVKAVPRGDGEIKVNLNYNDLTGNRRQIEKTVAFSSGYVQNVQTSSSKGAYFYLFWALVVLWIIFRVYRFYKKRKAKRDGMKLFKR